jgi:hypothetical protein
MSMLLFSPFFWLLSLLGGFLFGASMGLLCIVWFVSIYWRANPRDVLSWLRAAVLSAFLVAAGPVLIFLVFRAFFGKYEFVLSSTLANAAKELIISRYNLFISGAFSGLLGVLLLFFASYVFRLWFRRLPIASSANAGRPPWPEGASAAHRT